MTTEGQDRDLRQVVDLISYNVDDCVARLDRIEASQHAHGKILAAHGEMLEIHGQRLGRIEGRLHSLESRMEALSEQMQVFVDWSATVETRFDNLTNQSDLIISILNTQSEQVALLSGRMGSLASQMDSLAEAMRVHRHGD